MVKFLCPVCDAAECHSDDYTLLRAGMVTCTCGQHKYIALEEYDEDETKTEMIKEVTNHVEV